VEIPKNFTSLYKITGVSLKPGDFLLFKVLKNENNNLYFVESKKGRYFINTSDSLKLGKFYKGKIFTVKTDEILLLKCIK
jgi:hypothetical protein